MIQRSLGHSSIQIYPNPLHTYWLIPIRSCSIPFILDLLCQILSLLFETLPLFSASGLPTLPWERLTRTSSTILDKHKNELNNTIRSWYFYVFLCSVREARDRAIWTSTAMVTWPGNQESNMSNCQTVGLPRNENAAWTWKSSDSDAAPFWSRGAKRRDLAPMSVGYRQPAALTWRRILLALTAAGLASK